MRLLTSRLLPLAILGVLLFFGSFVRLQLEFVRPDWIYFCLGVALLAAVVAGLVYVVRSPAGQIETVDEKEHDGPPRSIPNSPFDRLRLPWNSQDVAYWPASETLAAISEISYEPPYEADQSYRSLGFTEVMPVVQGSMIGYILSGEDVTVIAFRGTDAYEVSDWIANLRRSAIKTEHGDVHQGFYLAYQSMKSQVDTILKNRDITHLWVAGHSLGGALALMCAYDLDSIEERQLNGLITFGQPMVAQQQFAEYIDTQMAGRYARFVNRDDIVPKVPPSHAACGSLVWFTDDGIKRSKVTGALSCLASPEGTAAASAAPSDEAEVQPLSDAEFAALQVTLKTERADLERLPDGTPIMAVQAQALTMIDDHSMPVYLEKVRSLLGLSSTKAS